MATDNAKIFDEPLKQLNELQAKTLEPAKTLTKALLGSYQQFAQLNYAVMGDLVNFSIDQSKLVSETDDATAFFEAQQSAAKSLSDTLGERAGEYANLATELQNKVQSEATTPRKNSKSTTKKAA